ncbi:FXYD domain-containing ion transport regulator 7 isoform X1 [Tachyglossus aculeatus]|uniref:FXYD domain-containing ion transport regulator 7 isoform X1 n=1 Tax=Tachyglossus aculeatus TaxID=9261 RepID=UPI0018F59BD4|nr:FXYD domain-containing ion transport regulator 7 isoform X1 [Tachyglossus aculeatus]
MRTHTRSYRHTQKSYRCSGAVTSAISRPPTLARLTLQLLAKASGQRGRGRRPPKGVVDRATRPRSRTVRTALNMTTTRSAPSASPWPRSCSWWELSLSSPRLPPS